MSKWMNLDNDGNRIVSIASMEQCKNMYNEVCCAGESEYVGDYPSDADCKGCPFFEKEDGVL